MFNTRVVMPDEQGPVKDLCHMLWAKCFDDTEQYTDYYFNNRWNKSITVLSNRVSMLHLNPYSTIINEKETVIYNIAGVCTLKEYRKRGYMDSVLKKAFGLMYRQEKPFTYLMPVSEEIYRPYGFTGIYPVESFNGGIKLTKDNADISICIPYGMLKERQKEDLIKYTKNKLAGNFTCYTVHNKSYFQALYEEMQACGGDIMVFWDKCSGICLGYAVYLCEDIPEIIESVFEKKIQDEILGCIARLGSLSVKIYETNFWDLDSQGIEDKKNYLMARIINLKTFAEYIYTKERKEMWLEVTDNLISGNNGRWHIITGAGETYCQKCVEMAKVNNGHFIKCTIEELGQEYLGKMNCFLNELV